ncbi:MAG TPA: SRPBCC family protein [Vicinamibacteria bacterium]|jgi:hypothetical protein
MADRMRVSRSYTQSISGPPEAVFPLLCPVRETEWVPGWRYRMVYSRSGVAEKGCVFTTPHHGAVETTWLVVDYEPPRRIRFVRVTAGATAVEIEIQVAPRDAGSAVDVRYTHTALSDEGDALVAAMTEDGWRRDMERWERAMNHFLATGTLLQG